MNTVKGPESLKEFYEVCRVLDVCTDPFLAYKTLFSSTENSFLLESSVVREGFSRFSFLGDTSGPDSEVIRYDINQGTVLVEHEAGVQLENISDFFSFIGERLASYRVHRSDELPFDFSAGYVGYLAYELKAHTVGAPVFQSKEPASVLMFCSRLVVVDHVEKRTYLVSLSRSDNERIKAKSWLDSTEEVLRCLDDARHSFGQRQSSRMSVDEVERWISRNAHIRHSRDEYISRIRKAMQDIVDGETYEVCLTNMIEFVPDFNPLDLYQILRQRSPAPHAGFFRAGDLFLLSASPERFLCVDRERRVQAKPIKGTRPRGRTPEEDRLQIKDLLDSEKDRAENLMIVDLLRNDLGRVCEMASVHVPGLFEIETYSHVHQLVSTIEGKLKRDVTTMECVRAAFPGGSMTGAPKIRTMEIIDRLEGGARGIYSGVFGWFDFSGACDLNIVIRSLVVQSGKARFGVGGALTALSDPEEEFIETMVKARNLIEAIESLKNERETHD